MQREILNYMDTRIASEEDPRRFGKPLRHELRGLWRYRSGTIASFATFGKTAESFLF